MSEAAAKDARGAAAERWLFRGLIALVALAPLPLASNRPLPAALLALGAGLLLIGWGAHIAIGGRIAVSPAKLRLPLILFGAVAAWIAVQALPIMPASWADPIWTEAAAALGEPLAASLSVNPAATLSGLMRLLSYAAVFWLSLQLTRHDGNARVALAAVAFIGAAYALYGIAVYFSGNNWILIWRKWDYHEALSATFVNRNSFATFAGLALLCAVAWFINGFRHLLTLERPARQRMALVAEAMFSQSLIRTIATLALMTALVLTGSRAGIVSSMAALGVLMLAFAGGGTLRTSHAAAAGALVAALMAAIFAVNGGLFADRIARADANLATNDRGIVYAATMDAVATAPWKGTGYGTYREVFTAYRPEGLPTQFYWDKAHNDYLENALELGLPAAIALNLSILLLAAEALRGLWRRRRDRTGPAIGVAATVLVGLHAFFDFSLQMPAVSVLYAFIMGFAMSQSWPKAGSRSPR
ncbi:O-antigen polymerase [Parvibaculum lavamentivorans DS-1]|uniref:O-antigen polymerase n=1 Tax=Parvibaculum lavamentivorans (strain DS-1 / DSM 13023 / NCIMB 13966) TaxID=402881 RepID=A7HUE0_PARL1|nr:O-antigen ligase family protein [Parvibaculum lavamentivorans]ABS63523.1 O-antigen polymerase [Parvibaculum lavamentivorans DS-1]